MCLFGCVAVLFDMVLVWRPFMACGICDHMWHRKKDKSEDELLRYQQ